MTGLLNLYWYGLIFSLGRPLLNSTTDIPLLDYLAAKLLDHGNPRLGIVNICL